MVALDPSIVDGGKSSNITVGSTTGLTVTAYLNKLVNEKISGVAWDDPEADPVTFSNIIKVWNDMFKDIATQKKNNPDWWEFGFPSSIGQVTHEPMGLDWEVPPTLDENLLLNSLRKGIEKDFNKFKSKLELAKTQFADYVERSYYSFHNDSLTAPSIHDAWVDHMNALLNHMQTLWDEFGAPTVDNNNEKALDQWLKDNPSVTTMGDGSIVITEPSITITPAVADAATWVYFVPQATDIKGTLSARYNPPPHLSTKPFSPTAFANAGTSGSKNLRTVAINATAKDRTTVYGSYGKNEAFNQNLIQDRLGFLYQDAANANKLAKNMNISKSIKNLWGFQFMYNPTSFSYTQTSDPQIDWTGAGGSEGDISNILFGQGQATFTLYINRIADMGLLPNAYDPKIKSYTKGYPRAITDEDALGILTRGTEYDLEFLYRTLNGDPQKSPVMKNGKPTSDWGVIYGIPIWLRLHDNMRWKVVINSLTVNHVMFTPDMIPMLSEISIGVTRIPVISFDADTEKRFYDSLTQDTTNSGNNG